jgi:methionyl-tRNA formyltransferase
MRVLFMGTGDIGIPSLRALLESPSHEVVGVITQPDKPVGRKQILQAPPIKILASEHCVPVFQPSRLRDTAAIERVAELEADVFVVMAYGQILPRAVLDLPPVACVNLHASILPRHRGAAPIQAAIEAGDTESGITVMHMDAGLDTGDIILTKTLPIREFETGGSLHDRLGNLAPVAMLEALALLDSGTAPRLPQDNSAATYAPKLTREGGVVDWSASAEVVDRKIRAMNPWPAASTTFPCHSGSAMKRLKIFSASIEPDADGKPGVVLSADRAGLLVAAGRGGLRLGEVQLEGKKKMPSRDLLLGNPIEVGTQLGETVDSK